MSLLDGPGDLSHTPLAAVLLEALNLRATGVLEVSHGGGTSRLWFRDGRPVGAQVFVGFRPLGMMLLQSGRIDLDTLSRSLVAMAETHRPQGELLVEMGAISEEEVARALAEQQGAYFGIIAALDAGPFSFDRVAAVPEWTRGSRLSPLRTIVDALARPQAVALVLGALEPARAGVRLSQGGRAAAASLDFAVAERELVARLEEPLALDAALAATPLPPERVSAFLAALLLLGLAVPADAEGTGSVALALDPETLGPAPDRAPARPVGGAEGAPASPASPPRAVPAPPPPAASSPPPGPPPQRSDPAEARARRQRLLQQAMRNMGVGPFAGRPGEHGEAAAAPAPKNDAPAPPRAAGAAPSEETVLREALLAALPRSRERDLFARLGVPETAGREEVKKVFLSIARRFHPDRFASPALADLRDAVRDYFAAVNEAYGVLSDDRKRTEYLASRRGKAAAHAEAARVDFLKAEACLRTRDFQKARAFLEAAVRAERRAEYAAALAFACLADPQRPDKARARELLEEAKRDPGCDRAFYVAGLLARDEGDEVAAERHFRAALQANPRNADATRELRRVEGRRGRGRD